jgi:hypothetical protein
MMANTLGFYNGEKCLGYVTIDEGVFIASGPAGNVLGKFDTCVAAARAVTRAEYERLSLTGDEHIPITIIPHKQH